MTAPNPPDPPFPPPGAGGGPAGVHDALFARRIVQLRGPLDEPAAGELATRLMYLDGAGDEAVTLFVDSEGGPVSAALTLVDTIQLLGVPLDTVALGRAEGSAVAVVAAGRRRLAAPHARFRLSEPPVAACGRAQQLQSWAEHHLEQSDRFTLLLARLTGRPREHVEADVAAGRWLDSDGAVAYGIVDGLWGPEQDRSDRPRRPFGYGPI